MIKKCIAPTCWSCESVYLPACERYCHCAVRDPARAKFVYSSFCPISPLICQTDCVTEREDIIAGPEPACAAPCGETVTGTAPPVSDARPPMESGVLKSAEAVVPPVEPLFLEAENEAEVKKGLPPETPTVFVAEPITYEMPECPATPEEIPAEAVPEENLTLEVPSLEINTDPADGLIPCEAPSDNPGTANGQDGTEAGGVFPACHLPEVPELSLTDTGGFSGPPADSPVPEPEEERDTEEIYIENDIDAEGEPQGDPDLRETLREDFRPSDFAGENCGEAEPPDSFGEREGSGPVSDSGDCCPPEEEGMFGRGLLYYRKWWERTQADIFVRGDRLTGIPIFTERNTLRVVNRRYSYFIPMEKIDYIRTADGLESYEPLQGAYGRNGDFQTHCEGCFSG